MHLPQALTDHVCAAFQPAAAPLQVITTARALRSGFGMDFLLNHDFKAMTWIDDRAKKGLLICFKVTPKTGCAPRYVALTHAALSQLAIPFPITDRKDERADLDHKFRFFKRQLDGMERMKDYPANLGSNLDHQEAMDVHAQYKALFPSYTMPVPPKHAETSYPETDGPRRKISMNRSIRSPRLFIDTPRLAYGFINGRRLYEHDFSALGYGLEGGTPCISFLMHDKGQKVHHSHIVISACVLEKLIARLTSFDAAGTIFRYDGYCIEPGRIVNGIWRNLPAFREGLTMAKAFAPTSTWQKPHPVKAFVSRLVWG